MTVLTGVLCGFLIFRAVWTPEVKLHNENVYCVRLLLMCFVRCLLKFK